jgi:hypothetical protein
LISTRLPDGAEHGEVVVQGDEALIDHRWLELSAVQEE